MTHHLQCAAECMLARQLRTAFVPVSAMHRWVWTAMRRAVEAAARLSDFVPAAARRLVNQPDAHYTAFHRISPHCTTLHHTSPHFTTCHHASPHQESHRLGHSYSINHDCLWENCCLAAALQQPVLYPTPIAVHPQLQEPVRIVLFKRRPSTCSCTHCAVWVM